MRIVNVSTSPRVFVLRCFLCLALLCAYLLATHPPSSLADSDCSEFNCLTIEWTHDDAAPFLVKGYNIYQWPGISPLPPGSGVEVTFVPLEHEIVVAFNAGGPAMQVGIVDFTDDSAYHQGGRAHQTSRHIRNAHGYAAIYQSERWGDHHYEILLPDGDYIVVGMFAEIVHNETGKRSFNVRLNETSVMNEIDLAEVAGPFTAYNGVWPVTISNGVLRIELETITDNASLTGLVVMRPQPLYHRLSGFTIGQPYMMHVTAVPLHTAAGESKPSNADGAIAGLMSPAILRDISWAE